MFKILRFVVVLFVLDLCVFGVETSKATDAVAKAFARTKEIEKDVAFIRGRPFKKDVGCAVQSLSDFSKYVESAIDLQFGAENRADAYVAALVKMGVLKKSLDLKQTFLTIMKSQAAAYYEPKSDMYYLLMTNMPAMMLDVTTSHEICHAMQDQYYDLSEFMEGDLVAIRDNGDAAAAKQCLVEGEATLVMTYWSLMNQMNITNSAAFEPLATLTLGAEARMDLKSIIDMSASQLKGLGGDASVMVDALDSTKGLPRFFIDTLFASYFQGSLMVNYVKADGGWAAVDELFKHPPTSTEQVLHPEKLLGKRDVPVDVRMPDLEGKLPKGLKLEEEDVLGELGIRVMLKMWQDPKESGSSCVAAAGWGGDRYYYFKKATDGSDLLVWKTVWDSSNDADEFLASYRVILNKRFPEMKKTRKPDVWAVGNGRYIRLVKRNSFVGVVDSCDRNLLYVIW